MRESFGRGDASSSKGACQTPRTANVSNMAGFAHFGSELEAFLGFLRQVDREFNSGSTVEEIRERYELSEEQFAALCDRYATPLDSGKAINRSPTTSAVIPIFHRLMDSDETAHQGSGVLMKISGTTFVLTAGHVAAGVQSGSLYIPGRRGLIPLVGGVSYTRRAIEADRDSDKVDVGYVRMNSATARKIHPSFTAVGLEDIDAADDVERVPLATFVGYPCSKSRKHCSVHSTETVTYTGHVWSRDVYEKLGYSRSGHICIKMRLKRASSSLFGSNSIAPHPRGVSGGAILAWPETYVDRVSDPKLKLIGIAHTYDKRANCLAGTHVMVLIRTIARNNQRLRGVIDRYFTQRAARASTSFSRVLE